MKSGWWIWTSTIILFALLGPEAEAGRTFRDSGGAMQSHDSRMMSSPVEAERLVILAAVPCRATTVG